MTTFDKFVHDFGLQSSTWNDWISMPPRVRRELIKQAPPDWWRKTLRDLSSAGHITRQSFDRLQCRARKVPKWLLYGDHSRHYLGVIPRDIRGIIYGYFTKMETNIIHENFVSRATQFFGTIHSFNGCPAFVSRSYDKMHYSWYNLGRASRSGDRPHTIETSDNMDTVTWMKGGKPIILGRYRCGSAAEYEYTHGCNATSEFVIRHFLRNLGKYKV